MNLDYFTVHRIQRIMDGYIDLKIPASLRTSVRLVYEMEPAGLVITELRSSEERYQWDRKEIALFRYENNQWQVYAKKEKDQQEPSLNWQLVTQAQPQLDFEEQLQYVEEDPLGVFWPEDVEMEEPV